MYLPEDVRPRTDIMSDQVLNVKNCSYPLSKLHTPQQSDNPLHQSTHTTTSRISSGVPSQSIPPPNYEALHLQPTEH